MKLELGTIQIKQFTFAEKTSLAGGHLQLLVSENLKSLSAPFTHRLWRWKR